jgi:hypothetical protein
MTDGEATETAVEPRARSAVSGRPAFWAAAATILVLGWQIATVHANYSGNCSGLFRTGTQISVPPGLIATTYRDASPIGYDGQFYRFLAHDPWLRQETAAYLDDPRLRSYRILVPALAWAIAGGQPQLIDDAYVLVLAAFIFVGVYWLGCLMVLQGRSAAYGLLFLAVPATLISIDRMTVDVALAALTAGLALQFARGRELWLWPILSAAALARETGLLLVAACAVAALSRREFKKALAWLSAAIPALCWYGYLHYVLPPVAAERRVIPKWAIPSFRFGALMRALDPPRYHLPHQQEVLARGMDSLALLAMIATAGLAVWLLRHTPDPSLRLVLGLQVALLAATTSPAFWITPFGYARVFGPLFVLVLSAGAARRGHWALTSAIAFALIVDLRLSTEIRSQVYGVIRWSVGV